MRKQDDKISAIRNKIEDLQKRWPAHTPRVTMFIELERLEQELARLLAASEDLNLENEDFDLQRGGIDRNGSDTD